MNNNLKSNNHNNTIIIRMIIFLIILIILLFILIIKNKLSDSHDKNEPQYFSCSQSPKDIQFATLNTYYNFYYENNTVNNGTQIYIFNFKNIDYYNLIGTAELFTIKAPDVEEFDSENLTKTFFINDYISYTEEIKDINDYINKVSDYGYTNCHEIN